MVGFPAVFSGFIGGVALGDDFSAAPDAGTGVHGRCCDEGGNGQKNEDRFMGHG